MGMDMVGGGWLDRAALDATAACRLVSVLSRLDTSCCCCWWLSLLAGIGRSEQIQSGVRDERGQQKRSEYGVDTESDGRSGVAGEW
jgi:hypothetical protein